jgi:hypothetical protein
LHCAQVTPSYTLPMARLLIDADLVKRQEMRTSGTRSGTLPSALPSRPFKFVVRGAELDQATEAAFFCRDFAPCLFIRFVKSKSAATSTSSSSASTEPNMAYDEVAQLRAELEAQRALVAALRQQASASIAPPAHEPLVTLPTQSIQ